MEDTGIVSVTLADIYAQQGHFEQSIQIYKVLVRKDPRNKLYKNKISSLKKDLKARQKASYLRNR